MSEITVLPVRTSHERKIFLNFPWKIYKNDPIWVPPLLPDLAARIDPKRGIFFQRGEAEFYIAWQNGQVVGTICAAEDTKTNSETNLHECIFGFFNFIEDYHVMEALLAQARVWATRRGLDLLTGPFNLDYEDSYGILVEGRDQPATLMCGHTPPYYLDFVERYGFQPVRGDNIAYAVDLTTESPKIQELTRMAERVRERTHYTIRSADMSHWEEELERIYILLNTTMRHLPDYRPWPREVVFNSLSPFRKIADPDLILFAEDGDQTVGWLPGIPNLNELYIHLNGLRKPWDYLKLVRLLHLKTECLCIKSVLVPQDYWGSGVSILLFAEMYRRARQRGYRWIDASLTSLDNPRTPAMAKRLGARLYKRYRVYRIKI